MSPADTASSVLALAKKVSGDHPSKVVNLTVTGSVYHTPSQCPDFTLWTLSVGHSETVNGRTFEELMEKFAAIGSPESKLKKAAELRRQADSLEAEASFQPTASENHDHEPE